MTFKRVLIAVDSEPIGVHAAVVGMELAKAIGAEVGLIHVVDPSLVPADVGIAAADLITQARTDGRRLLADVRERAALKQPALEFFVEGAPPTEIMKAAQDWPADLIVIGSHGRGGLQRTILGSVAEAVMRRAPCPVLVVRSKK